MTINAQVQYYRAKEKSEPLKGIPANEAAKQAYDKAESYSIGQSALRTRWSNVNTLLMGGWRFGMIYTLAGSSGHGKSYFLNQIMEDMLDKTLNKDYPHNPIWLHFGFEMSPADEVLRAAARHLEVSYSSLLSLNEKISPELKARLKEFCKNYKPKIMYFPKAGTALEIMATIEYYQRTFPDRKLIISIDHILLVREENNEDELKLMSFLSKMFVDCVNDNMMVFLLAQLNAEIEKESRITNKTLHFPLKRDIHGSKQLFHASDGVIIIHQPELLNIEYYGRDEDPTLNTIFIHVIKYRSDKPGYTRLKNDLDNGRFLEWEDRFESEALLGDGGMKYEFPT